MFTSCSLRGAESNGLGLRKLRRSIPSLVPIELAHFHRNRVTARHWRIMLEKVADSARKAVTAEPYKPYGGQFLEFCSISLSTYQSFSSLSLPAATTRYGMFSISFLGADRWNSLPVSCRQVEHLSVFVSLCKEHLGFPVTRRQRL